MSLPNVGKDVLHPLSPPEEVKHSQVVAHALPGEHLERAGDRLRALRTTLAVCDKAGDMSQERVEQQRRYVQGQGRMATTLAAHVLRGSPRTRTAQGGTFILILQMGKQAEGHTAIKWYVGISNLCLGLIYNSKHRTAGSSPATRGKGEGGKPLGRWAWKTLQWEEASRLLTHTYAPDSHFTANRHRLPNRGG